MRKSGGIIALIAGVLSLMAATFTLFVGGVGANFNAEAGDTIILLGWGGLFVSFAIIVLGAIAMNAKTFMPGLLIIIASIFGVIYGGTLVAVLMILALVGGILACMSDGNAEPIEMQPQDAKSNVDSLIGVVCIAGLILIGIFYFSKPNQQISDAPIAITIPEDNNLTDEPPTVSTNAIAEAAPADGEVFLSRRDILENNANSFLGKPPLNLLNDEYYLNVSKKLLGNHYDKFLANIAVSSGIEMDSNYLLGFGCNEGICPTEQAAFAIDKLSGQMIAVLVTSEGDLLFGVDSVDKLPENLQSWYTQLEK